MQPSWSLNQGTGGAQAAAQRQPPHAPPPPAGPRMIPPPSDAYPPGPRSSSEPSLASSQSGGARPGSSSSRGYVPPFAPPPPRAPLPSADASRAPNAVMKPPVLGAGVARGPPPAPPLSASQQGPSSLGYTQQQPGPPRGPLPWRQSGGFPAVPEAPAPLPSQGAFTPATDDDDDDLDYSLLLELDEEEEKKAAGGSGAATQGAAPAPVTAAIGASQSAPASQSVPITQNLPPQPPPRNVMPPPPPRAPVRLPVSGPTPTPAPQQLVQQQLPQRQVGNGAAAYRPAGGLSGAAPAFTASSVPLPTPGAVAAAAKAGSSQSPGSASSSGGEGFDAEAVALRQQLQSLQQQYNMVLGKELYLSSQRDKLHAEAAAAKMEAARERARADAIARQREEENAWARSNMEVAGAIQEHDASKLDTELQQAREARKRAEADRARLAADMARLRKELEDADAARRAAEVKLQMMGSGSSPGAGGQGGTTGGPPTSGGRLSMSQPGFLASGSASVASAGTPSAAVGARGVSAAALFAATTSAPQRLSATVRPASAPSMAAPTESPAPPSLFSTSPLTRSSTTDVATAAAPRPKSAVQAPQREQQQPPPPPSLVASHASLQRHVWSRDNAVAVLEAVSAVLPNEVGALTGAPTSASGVLSTSPPENTAAGSHPFQEQCARAWQGVATGRAPLLSLVAAFLDVVAACGQGGLTPSAVAALRCILIVLYLDASSCRRLAAALQKVQAAPASLVCSPSGVTKGDNAAAAPSPASSPGAAAATPARASSLLLAAASDLMQVTIMSPAHPAGKHCETAGSPAMQAFAEAAFGHGGCGGEAGDAEAAARCARVLLPFLQQQCYALVSTPAFGPSVVAPAPAHEALPSLAPSLLAGAQAAVVTIAALLTGAASAPGPLTDCLSCASGGLLQAAAVCFFYDCVGLASAVETGQEVPATARKAATHSLALLLRVIAAVSRQGAHVATPSWWQPVMQALASVVAITAAMAAPPAVAAATTGAVALPCLPPAFVIGCLRLQAAALQCFATGATMLGCPPIAVPRSLPAIAAATPSLSGSKRLAPATGSSSSSKPHAAAMSDGEGSDIEVAPPAAKRPRPAQLHTGARGPASPPARSLGGSGGGGSERAAASPGHADASASASNGALRRLGALVALGLPSASSTDKSAGTTLNVSDTALEHSGDVSTLSLQHRRPGLLPLLGWTGGQWQHSTPGAPAAVTRPPLLLGRVGMSTACALRGAAVSLRQLLLRGGASPQAGGADWINALSAVISAATTVLACYPGAAAGMVADAAAVKAASAPAAEALAASWEGTLTAAVATAFPAATAPLSTGDLLSCLYEVVTHATALPLRGLPAADACVPPLLAVLRGQPKAATGSLRSSSSGALNSIEGSTSSGGGGGGAGKEAFTPGFK